METSNPALEISNVSDTIAKTSKPSRYPFLKRHSWFIAVSLLVVIAAIPRLYRLNAVGLWLDECYQYYYATYDWDKIQDRVAVSQAPFAYFLSKLQITLFPWRGEAFLRLPSVILGLALIPVCYFLGKELFRKKEVGFLTALLATFWPILVNYSQEFRMYAMFVFLAGASATLLLNALRTQNVASWFGVTVVNMLLLITHYNTFFVQGAECVFIGLYLLVGLINSIRKTKSIWEGWKQQSKAIGYAVGSLTLIGTAYLLYLSALLKFFASGSEGLGSADKPLPFDLEIYKSIFSDLGLGKDFALIFVLLLAILGIISALIKLPWSAVFAFIWFVVPFLVLSFSKGGSGILVSPRYFIFFVPVYLAIVAGGILFLGNGIAALFIRLRPALSNQLQKMRWGIIVLSLAALSIFIVVSLSAYYAAPKQINVDTRSAFEVVKNGTQPGDVLITFNGADWDSGAPWFNFLYTFYNMRKPPAGLNVLKAEDWTNPTTFAKALKSNGRLWTMITYSGDTQNLATMAGPEAQTTCFYRACAILQPNPPNTTMVQKFEKFLQSFNSLNPDLTKSIRDSLNQAKPLIANR